MRYGNLRRGPPRFPPPSPTTPPATARRGGGSTRELEPGSHNGEAVSPPARPSFDAGSGVARVESLPRRRRWDGEGSPAGILLAPVGEQAAVEEAAQLVGAMESRKRQWWSSGRAGGHAAGEEQGREGGESRKGEIPCLLATADVHYLAPLCPKYCCSAQTDPPQAACSTRSWRREGLAGGRRLCLLLPPGRELGLPRSAAAREATLDVVARLLPSRPPAVAAVEGAGRPPLQGMRPGAVAATCGRGCRQTRQGLRFGDIARCH
jgi:hypothetical protein